MEAVRATAEGAISIKTKEVRAFGTEAADALLQQLNLSRRKPTPHDVEIEIMYCGVCHSDLHTARNEWHSSIYPCVPGHEIVGRIVSVGGHVNKFKVGDLAAVGCMVDSYRQCDYSRKAWNNIAKKVIPEPIIRLTNTWVHKRMVDIRKALLWMKPLFYEVEDAKRLGADDVVLSKDDEQMQRYAGKLDFVLDAGYLWVQREGSITV
jgi:D-arabinose 1-dehydrogenase-like Zn-dependent alcohol dehydrogenase